MQFLKFANPLHMCDIGSQNAGPFFLILPHCKSRHWTCEAFLWVLISCKSTIFTWELGFLMYAVHKVQCSPRTTEDLLTDWDPDEDGMLQCYWQTNSMCLCSLWAWLKCALKCAAFTGIPVSHISVVALYNDIAHAVMDLEVVMGGSHTGLATCSYQGVSVGRGCPPSHA